MIGKPNAETEVARSGSSIYTLSASCYDGLPIIDGLKLTADDDVILAHLLQKIAQLPLGIVLRTADGLLYPVVNHYVLFLLISKRWFSTVCLSLLTRI